MVKHIKQRNRFQASTVLTLALWQMRRTWFLLLIILLGMIAAVVIVCSIPLLSDVMTTAGLRNTLRATPDSADILLNTETDGISSSIVQDVHNQFDPLLRKNVGKTLVATQSSLTCGDFSFSPSRRGTQLTAYGTSLTQAAPHLGPLQGRVAQTVAGHPDEIELMMTPDTAQLLGAHIGTSFKLSLGYNVFLPLVGEQQHTAMVTAHVVGLFNVTPANAAYWHGENFAPTRTALENGTTLSNYIVLTSDQTLLALFDHLSAVNHTDAIHTESYSGYGLIWHYQLDAAQLASSDLNPLINSLANVQSTMDAKYADLEHATTTDSSLYSPYLTYAQITSPVLSSSGDSTLNQLYSRVTVARIPSGVFTILIIALVLFFVSLTTTLLVDRQTETIALLRSRGASQGQIFCSLLLQAGVVGILALLVGLLFTLFAVLFLAQRLLPATAADALNIITDHPLQAIAGTFGYGLVIVLITLLAMSFSLFITARMDVLALRRETARSNRRPFWQRFYLDIAAGIIALTAYGFLLYVTSVGAELRGR